MTKEQEHAEAVIAMQAEIDGLKRAMQIHAGDICSAENEASRFLQDKTELEEEVERLQAELDKHRWIPVSEGLPEDDGIYLVLKERGHSIVCGKNYGYRQEYDFDFQIMRATHWKPIILP